MAADREALTGNGLAIADALHQAVAYDRVLMLACAMATQHNWHLCNELQ